MRFAERPRERLVARGAAALTDAELLAVVLRTGVAGPPRSRSRATLLAALRRASPGSLLAPVPRNRGDARRRPRAAAQLKAIVELVRRALAAERGARRRADLAGRGARLPSADARRSRRTRRSSALFLDSQNRLIAAEELFRGTLAQTSVYPREVVKAALAHNAAAVIFAHNHPSGVAEPSRADELLTPSLKRRWRLVDIRTLDHFVVAGERVVSFAERGLL